MKASDLSSRDLDLIKSMANRLLVDTKENSAVKAIVQVLFECIHAKGMTIVRDESKEITWSELKPSHYDQSPRYKKPWIY